MSEEIRPRRFIETDTTAFVFDDDQSEEFADEEPPAPLPKRGGPQPAKEGDVALAGADGQSAAKLLRQAQEEGTAALGKSSAVR